LTGSICAIFGTIAANKLLYKDTPHNRRYQMNRDEPKPNTERLPSAAASKASAVPPKTSMGLFQACLPFLIILILVVATSNLFPAIHAPLSDLKTTIGVYAGAGAKTLTFSWLLTPGVLILLSTGLACFVQKQRLSALLAIAGSSVSQSRNPIITILSVVAMAKVMNYSGMTDSIALTLIAVLGEFYPFMAPVIGAMGTFITGSDTTCCILFGELQLKAANAVGADSFWIVAANLSGATAGKMISPQSVAIAIATAGMAGRDGEILRDILKYFLIYLLTVCLITFGRVLLR
jgi:lactate permease